MRTKFSCGELTSQGKGLTTVSKFPIFKSCVPALVVPRRVTLFGEVVALLGIIITPVLIPLENGVKAMRNLHVPAAGNLAPLHELVCNRKSPLV